MIRVYFASKLHHAQKWRDLCAATPHLQAHARWLKHHALGTTDTSTNARTFWLQDEQDVRDADAVVVYAEPHDHLRGALVEAGMALAYKVPVVVVGDHPDYGTWQHHPGVLRMPDLPTVLSYLKAMEPSYTRLARRNF